MTQVLVSSFICVLLIRVTFAAGPHPTDEYDNFECGRRNALDTDCATSCDVDRCPSSEHYSRVCDYRRCAPGCQCRFNEKFAANGSCIPAQNCPPFLCERQNEKYEACPPYRKDSCLEKTMWSFVLMVEECFPECRCQTGYCRRDGVCVHED